jgi:hypothetical protein
LVGWGLRSLTPDRVRRVAATALAVLSILSFVGSAHQSPDGLGGEDWRAAASAERSLVRDPDTPVLFQPPYYEARDLSLLRDPSIRGSLLSPLSIYPMRGRVILLPFWLSSSAERYLEPIVRRDLVRSRRIVLVTDSPADPFRSWLDGRLGTSGFTSHVVGDYGGEVLVVFARSG